MVEDRITDGKRIAQLLASELTGLATGPLERIGVDDADPDAEPSPGGTFAYDVVRDDDPVGAVFVHESSARIDLAVDADAVTEPVDTDGISLETTDDGALQMRVEYAAAVKRAVDLLVTVVDEE